MSSAKSTRLDYIDNLRVFLIGLVVLQHLSITYGAAGSWYYNESAAGFPEIVAYSMFTATNQAFFMGMFFLISAYFMVPSLAKKGIGKFMKDRLIRLGIPTLLFYFFLHPLTVAIVNGAIRGEEVSLVDYIVKYQVFGFGPMWFVEALIVFTLLYVLSVSVSKRRIRTNLIPLPTGRAILWFALLVGLGQYVVRIWLPVGWSMPITNFQLPHFLQYIVLFAAGIMAYENKWMHAITFKMGWRWFLFVQVMIFVGFPIVFISGGATEGNIDAYLGGLTWQSFAYAIWEQLVGFGMIIALLGIFKFRLNAQNSFAKKLSSSAYGVFVFHTPILVFVSALFLELQIPQFLKFIVLAPIALIVCFAVGFSVKKAPVLRRIF